MKCLNGLLEKKPRDEFGGKLTAMEIKRCEEVLPEDFVCGTRVVLCGGKRSNATYEGVHFVPDPSEDPEATAATSEGATTSDAADSAAAGETGASETDAGKR